ncbi:MAG TPA: hypothetical protein VFK51_06885 [Burkholderiales bacterium]|jgi:hypothetical protein|nr:hypothetical protein [Burkholderiales bacterium]
MSTRPTICGRRPDIFAEHAALLADYGEVQKRCTRLFADQAAEIERLRAETMRLRAAIVVRDTALAAMRDELAVLRRVPGLREHGPSIDPIDAPRARHRTTIVERLLPMMTRMRTAAQRWKQIRMLRI